MMHRFSQQRPLLPIRNAIRSRRGAASLWIILAGPALLGMLILVIELAHIWLARVELENALGATALAAVKEWGDAGGGSTACPRNVGFQYAAGNNIVGESLMIDTNFGGMPNGNASCNGDLIFGAIIDDVPPFRFDASVIPSCGTGQVRIEACKSDAGAGGGNNEDRGDRIFGIVYEDGPTNLVIRSVSFTIPIIGNNPNQQPYFDSTDNDAKRPRVSDFDTSDGVGDDGFPGDIPSCFGNLDNTLLLDNETGSVITTLDVRGLDPDPVAGNAATPLYECLGGKFSSPDPTNFDADGNPNGDICFSFSNQVLDNGGVGIANQYRTLTVHFRDGTFNPPSNPLDQDTFEFARFGASINRLRPPPPVAGDNNDGDAFGRTGVIVDVVFLNTVANTTTTCQAAFVDTVPNDERSEALCVGSSTSNEFAVRAQATVEVNSLFCELFGITLGPFNISAKETAFYDCAQQCPRLIRIEPGNFFCPGPAP